LAAIGSTELVQHFADIARQEYVAVGLRLALHPQIDLATEPRWSRISGGFGEDADVTSKLVQAYIRGFQGEQLGPESVSTMTKHFPGGGPQKDGEDPHFAYGREQVYPGNNFEYHLKPFRAAIAAGAAQIMPYYGMPVDTQYEAVAFGYNKGIITGLLRGELGFDGIVCTDWGLVTDAIILGQPMPARAWGVEHLDELSRVEMILAAGCDQFGGEARPELVVQLVEEGRISEERIDLSVRRLLQEKFILGLFDNPYVDPDHAAVTVGKAEFVAAGEDAQRRAYTLLTNRDQILPLDGPCRLYVEGLSAEVASQYGEVVGDPADADVALLRLKAPYEPRPGGFEAMFHAGSLEFPAAERDHHAAVCSAVPTIADVYLDRPAVLAQLADEAAALLGSYGSSDKAFLDIVFGVAQPEGSLPFDLPRSMAAVEASRSDVPFDTADPVFRFGHGTRYRDQQQ
jgi:beta-glucosidase